MTITPPTLDQTNSFATASSTLLPSVRLTVIRPSGDFRGIVINICPERHALLSDQCGTGSWKWTPSTLTSKSCVECWFEQYLLFSLGIVWLYMILLQGINTTQIESPLYVKSHLLYAKVL